MKMTVPKVGPRRRREQLHLEVIGKGQCASNLPGILAFVQH